jgi:hypothetical protein
LPFTKVDLFLLFREIITVYRENHVVVYVDGVDVSELRPPSGLFFVLQMIHAYGQPRWNDIDRGKPKNSERNLSQCHFVHHKFHMD